MISKEDTDKHQFTYNALKIQEFSNKSAAEMRKLLLKELVTTIDESFPDSLDEVKSMSPNPDSLGEVRSMSLNKARRRKSMAPVIPRINKKKKVMVQSSDVAAQRPPQPI